jgi:hypothetical protein
VTLPWWTGVPAAQATIACGEETHHLVWESGALTAPDHGDPEGERALAALGAEPLACIEMLAAWREHAEDLNVLLLGSRGQGDMIPAPAQMPQRHKRLPPGAAVFVRGGAGAGALTHLSHGALTRLSHGRAAPAPDPAAEEQFARLLSLGGGLGRRLDATVAAHWHRRLLISDAETDRLRARLHAALYGRVLATLVAWLGHGDVALQLELAPEGAEPSLRRAPDGAIAATIPFGWLLEVWARGLELVWGRFCLAASTTDGHAWELCTVEPSLDAPSTLTLTLPHR